MCTNIAGTILNIHLILRRFDVMENYIITVEYNISHGIDI